LIDFRPLAFFKLIRPLNCLIVLGSVAVGAVAGGSLNPLGSVFIAGVSACLIAAGGNGLNDVFDVKVDYINRPWRPIPSGQIREVEAFWLSVVLFFLGIITASIIGRHMLLVAIGTVALLVAYNLKLKWLPLLGNLTVSTLCGLVFVYGGMSVGKTSGALIPAGFALLFHLGREAIKDLEDLRGDKSVREGTVPIRFGPKTTIKVITVIYALLFLFTLLPFWTGLYGWLYLVAVVVGVYPVLGYAIWSLWRDSSPENLGRLSRILKADMLVGLLAILLGSTRI